MLFIRAAAALSNIVQRTVIEPIPKAVEPMFHQIFCCPKIEPGINCGTMSDPLWKSRLRPWLRSVEEWWKQVIDETTHIRVLYSQTLGVNLSMRAQHGQSEE